MAKLNSKKQGKKFDSGGKWHFFQSTTYGIRCTLLKASFKLKFGFQP